MSKTGRTMLVAGVLGVAAMVGGCTSTPVPVNVQVKTPVRAGDDKADMAAAAQAGEIFIDALNDGNAGAAHKLTTPAFQKKLSVTVLATNWQGLVKSLGGNLRWEMTAQEVTGRAPSLVQSTYRLNGATASRRIKLTAVLDEATKRWQINIIDVSVDAKATPAPPPPSQAAVIAREKSALFAAATKFMKLAASGQYHAAYALMSKRGREQTTRDTFTNIWRLADIQGGTLQTWKIASWQPIDNLPVGEAVLLIGSTQRAKRAKGLTLGPTALTITMGKAGGAWQVEGFNERSTPGAGQTR